jgi:hypothetical protein
MVALTASQAPGLDASPTHRSDQVAPPPGTPIDGDSRYYTQMPPLNSPTGPAAGAPGSRSGIGTGTGSTELPATVLDAYQRAQSAVNADDPRCNLRWQLLAAIGQVESNQARGGDVDSEGTTSTPILGPVLNGHGFADVTDTDHGEYDGDSAHDRAVGPMQFIPSTWAVWGADGTGDGVRDPNNIYDAALAAGRYLCADGRNLSYEPDLDRAILGYNHSQDYLKLVKSWYEHFLNGGVVQGPDNRSGAGRGSGSGSSTRTPASGAPASPSASPSPRVPRTPSPSSPKTPRPTATFSGTITPNPTGSEIGGNPSGSGHTPTTSPSPTSTTCPTGSASPATSPAPTASPTQSASPTPTASPTSTGSPSPTPSDGPCATASPSPSGDATDSPSVGESASGQLD